MGATFIVISGDKREEKEIVLQTTPTRTSAMGYIGHKGTRPLCIDINSGAHYYSCPTLFLNELNAESEAVELAVVVAVGQCMLYTHTIQLRNNSK